MDVLYVVDVMGDEDYLKIVAGYLKFPVRTLDSYYQKREEEGSEGSFKALKIHTRLLYSRGCGECRQYLRGDKMEQAQCCERTYDTACL